jgi:RNA polymerase sigma-70 factor (ECF subfamily)
MPQGKGPVGAASRATAAVDAHAADRELVRDVLAGDEAALESLRQRLARVPAMVRYQDARMGRLLNETELEDVVRETVAALWSKLSTFEGRASLETWMYRFAALELLKGVQRKCRSPQPLEDPWSAPDPRLAGNEGDGPEFDRAQLEEGLAALTEQAAAVIRQRHFEELDFEQIAERARLPLNTVKARYYRGLARLKEILERRRRRRAP